MTERRETAPPETRLDRFEGGSTTVAILSEEANERAWIQSTVTVPIEP